MELTASKLMKNNKFIKQTQKSTNKTCNKSKDVVRCKDLTLCESIEEIKTQLKSQNVSQVLKELNLNRYFFTPKFHESIKIGYLSTSVSTYPILCAAIKVMGMIIMNGNVTVLLSVLNAHFRDQGMTANCTCSFLWGCQF